MTCPEGALPLLALAEDNARERLLASPLGGLLPGEKVVNLFCGAGGWEAALKRLGIKCDYAVNHWPVACETHRLNYPDSQCYMGDTWETPPHQVCGDDTIGLLIASAACTSHSPARGAAPISPRVHMLGWCIARWLRDKMPRMFEIENVPAWLNWGPTMLKRDERGNIVRDKQGRAIRVQNPARLGREFKRLMRYIRKLGYVVEMRIQDAVDFGSASKRKRLFLKGRRDGMPIVWPEVTHGGTRRSTGGRNAGEARISKGDSTEVGAVGHSRASGVRCGGWTRATSRGAPDDQAHAGGIDGGGRSLQDFRTAADIIDWSDLGTSVFDRKKLLADKTRKRLTRGLDKHLFGNHRPFVLRLCHPEGGGGHVHSVDEPLPTQTARQDLAMCTPIVVKNYGDNRRSFVGASDVKDPLGTITSIDHHSLMAPILAPLVMQSSYSANLNGARPANQPLPTLTTCEDMMLGVPVLTPCGGPKREPSRPDEPMHTILTREDRGIATPVLVHNTTNHTGGPVSGPLPTVTTGGQTGIATPILTYANHGEVQDARVDQPLRTVVAGGLHAGIATPLLAAYYGANEGLTRPDEPLGCVVTKDRHALVTPIMRPRLFMFTHERALQTAAFLREHLGDKVQINAHGYAVCTVYGVEYIIVDILFRMLKVRELAAAMGFPPDYIWPKTQRDAVKAIGNAVQVDHAEALLAATLPRHRRTPDMRERRAAG